MIRLTKGFEPAILVENRAVWTAEFERLRAEGRSTSRYKRYKKKEIKAALVREVYGKCAYCESHVTHVYPDDVEHIRPKSRRPDLVVAWENLIFACARCNGAKHDYYDEAAPLINPYVDEPAEHLMFAGALIRHKPGSDLGRRSWQRLELQRAGLVERRGQRLLSVSVLIDVWYSLPNGSDKDLARRAILAEAADDKEFAAAVRAFIEQIAGLTIDLDD